MCESMELYEEMKKLDYIMRFARACVRHLWWGARVPSKSAREGRQAGSALMVEVFSKKRRGAHVGLLRGLCGGFNLGGGGLMAVPFPQ